MRCRRQLYGRLENNHGLSQRNHTSRFILNFSFFDVLAFGGSVIAWRAGRGIA
jgi:hypothetical protein